MWHWLWNRLKLPFLLLLYPVIAWLVLAGIDNKPDPRHWVIPGLNWMLGLLISASLVFPLSVPLLAWRFRKKPAHVTGVFCATFPMAVVLIVGILLVQALVLALAVYAANVKEVWVWGYLAAACHGVGTVLLVNSGVSRQPGPYSSLRAFRVCLDEQPRLKERLEAISETFSVSMPKHVLIGLRTDFCSITNTVLCPDGELEGGALYLPLPTSRILTVLEFEALAAHALLILQAELSQRQKEFLATLDQAGELYRLVEDTGAEWSILKWGLHPVVLFVRLIVVASVRLPLAIAKEWVAFFIREFCNVRAALIQQQILEADARIAARFGGARFVCALTKEATVCLAVQFALLQEGRVMHKFGEIAVRLGEEHIDLTIEPARPCAWGNPQAAWQGLNFRCSLLGASLDWCHRMALDVNPQPCAWSLFEGVAELQEKLVQAVNNPLLVRRNMKQIAREC